MIIIQARESASGIAVALERGCSPSARRSAQTIAITGGKVYPVSGPPIENGTVLIRDGKIVAVGANVAVPGRRAAHRRDWQDG